MPEESSGASHSTYRLSLIVFIMPVLTALVGYAFLWWLWASDKSYLYAFLARIFSPAFSSGHAVLYPTMILYGRVASSIAAALLFLIVFARLVVYLTTELRVFSDKVIWRQGFIRRDVTPISLPEIVGAPFQQSVLGRILGYGTVIINTRGDDQIVAHTLSGAPAASAEIMGRKSAAA